MSLNFELSPRRLEFEGFSLLGGMEFIKTPRSEFGNEVNELRARYEIVCEDRERVRREVEDMRKERFLNLNRLILENGGEGEADEEVEILMNSIERMRKECVEKDKLLNSMRRLVGGNHIVV